MTKQVKKITQYIMNLFILIFIISCNSHNKDSIISHEDSGSTACYASFAINDKEGMSDYLALIDRLLDDEHYKPYISKNFNNALILSSELCDHDNGNSHLTQNAINKVVQNDKVMWKNGFEKLSDIDFTSDEIVSSDELCVVSTKLNQEPPYFNQDVSHYLRNKIGIPVIANSHNGDHQYYFLYTPCNNNNELMSNLIEAGVEKFQNKTN